MVVLVTGATGFLGKYLLEYLKEFDLRIITRSPDKLDDRLVDIVRADISEDLDPSIFDDVEVLIHSAAKVGSWPNDPNLGYYQTNVEGTRNLLETAIDQNVDHIIYTSSYFALGPTGEGIKDETWDNEPKFEHPYISTKYKAGKIVDKLAEGCSITQLLPTIIVGKGIDNPISNNIIDYINGRLPGLPGGGRAIVNFVSADDVARAHLKAINSGKTGKYLIGGENMTYHEFFSLFGEKLGINPPRSLPFVFARMYAFFQEMRDNPKVTQGELHALSRNFQFTSKKAKEELGYSHHGIEQTVEEMIVGFLQTDKLNSKGEKRILNYINGN